MYIQIDFTGLVFLTDISQKQRNPFKHWTAVIFLKFDIDKLCIIARILKSYDGVYSSKFIWLQTVGHFMF